MMISEFLHYYSGYTVESVLSLYAITFFAMLATMYRLQGVEDLNDVQKQVASSSQDGYSIYMKDAQERAGGAHKILEEIKVLDDVR